MLKSNGLLIIFFLFQLVKPTCEKLQSQQQCNQVSECFWLRDCRAKNELLHSLRSIRAKSHPEIETESETENGVFQTVTQIGSASIASPIPQSQSALTCKVLNRQLCVLYVANCQWTASGCLEKHFSAPPMLPNMPMGYEYQREVIPGPGGIPVETETESESESQTEFNGAGMPANNNPSMQYGAGMPAINNPSMQYERESESESEMGTSQTYEYERESNIPGPGAGYQQVISHNGLIDTLIDTGVQPGPLVDPFQPYPDSGLPAPQQPLAPVTTNTDNASQKLKCLSLNNEEQCAAFIICEWDPREICVPGNVPVATQPSRPKVCGDTKEMIECVDADGCQWNIPTQSCKVFRNVVLRKAHTCTGIARPSCSHFFGCVWDTEQQMCSKEPGSAAITEVDPIVDPYSDVLAATPQQPAQPAMYCLTMSMTDCDVSALCFWDIRMICLPMSMQQETTRKATDSRHNFFHPTTLQGNPSSGPDPAIQHKASFFHPTDPNSPISDELSPPGAPGRGTPATDSGNIYIGAGIETESESENESGEFYSPQVHPSRQHQPHPFSPGLETETESESESEFPSMPQSHSPIPHPRPHQPSPLSPGLETETETESESGGFYPGSIGAITSFTTTAINICFYHPDRQTCLADSICFWDRRTHLCASLEVPNFLPATCEGFLYEHPCTLDKRCIWKTGECEEANLDCEDMYTKDKCLRTKYYGIPCVWSDHEMECDEAPIMLQRKVPKIIAHKQAEFFFLWPVLIVVPFAFIVYSLHQKVYSKETQNDLLLDDVFPDAQVI